MRFLVDVNHFGRCKAIEMSGCCSAIGTYVSAIKEIATFQVGGKIFSHGNYIQSVAGRTEYCADLGGSGFESVKVISAVVENYTRKSAVDAVIDIVTKFAVPNCFADDGRYGGSSRCYYKSSWLGNNFYIRWKESFQFRINPFRQFAERLC